MHIKYIIEFCLNLTVLIKILLTASSDQLLYNLNLIMFGMFKTKRNSKNCKRCSYKVTNLDII